MTNAKNQENGTRKTSKLDVDRVVFYLKDIMNSPQPLTTLLHPIDHAIAFGEMVKWNAVRDQARDTLIKMHEAGMINLADYRTD